MLKRKRSRLVGGVVATLLAAAADRYARPAT
jgi:hypothetical protein